METHDRARAELREYRGAREQGFFDADPFFETVLRHHLGTSFTKEEREELRAFGRECAGPIDELARETNRDENLPRLRRWDGIGERVDEVVFHPGYDEIGERVYRTGVISGYREPGNELRQLAHTYLFGHDGEAGHLCPLACTAGLVKILMSVAPKEVRERYLPGLLREDRLHPEHFHASQFLTEVQGGSDVGANATMARRDGDAWRISGEKWFCSVIDADLFLLTARPEGALEGTAGLGAFVVPRLLEDGSSNGFRIRRLKYKLGTRSMASAEADFDDALAHPIAVDGGFKPIVEIVLNTSRLYNAVASSGMMSRVAIEAEAYAAHRSAFGQPIAHFPLVGRSLHRIRNEARAAMAGTFALAALADRIAREVATEEERAVHRLVVNMNKYWTSIRATAVIHEGIEVLGGNGAIEDFSILPRLYRDAIVLESWEGTHNVLCIQVLKDMQRYRLHEPFFAQIESGLEREADGERKRAIGEATLRLRERTNDLLLADPETAQLEVRSVVDGLALLWQLAALLAVGGEDAHGAIEYLLREGSRVLSGSP